MVFLSRAALPHIAAGHCDGKSPYVQKILSKYIPESCHVLRAILLTRCVKRIAIYIFWWLAINKYLTNWHPWSTKCIHKKRMDFLLENIMAHTLFSLADNKQTLPLLSVSCFLISLIKKQHFILLIQKYLCICDFWLCLNLRFKNI